jgi:hypothetical protein
MRPTTTSNYTTIQRETTETAADATNPLYAAGTATGKDLRNQCIIEKYE